MQLDEPLQLQKLVGRQRRPSTGDIFRVRLLNGNYYFGLVVDGNMEVSPMAPGAILSVIFKESSRVGILEGIDQLD